MSSSSTGGGGEYLLGHGADEIRHLVNQAEVYAHEANQLLDRVELSAGGSAIDVGCGALGIVHLLADRVGESGRVVGVDREPRMLEHARTVARIRGLNVEFIEADATSLTLPSNEFDLVHCRTVLMNVSDPVAVLAEMVRIARPGGVVAVQEPDAAAWVCDPPHLAFESLQSELVAAYARSGKEFNIGRRLVSLLRQVGLSPAEVIPTARVTRPGEYYHTFLATMMGLVKDLIVTGGTMTVDQFEDAHRALLDHLAVADSLTCQPMTWQAWAIKP